MVQNERVRRDTKQKLIGVAIAVIATVAILLGPVAMILVVVSGVVAEAFRRTRSHGPRAQQRYRRDTPPGRAA
jgi:hypothetical protein